MNLQQALKRMRRIGISIIGIVVFYGMTIIDGGDCVRFFGEFELSSGETIKGYTHSVRTDFENAENDFKRFLYYSYGDVKIYDSIWVFNEIDTLKSTGIKGSRSHCDFFYLACPIEKVKKIGFEDWTRGRMIEKYPCETCNQKVYPFAAGGYSPVIITELNEDEVKTLVNEVDLNRFVIRTGYEETTAIYLISLDNNYAEKQLETFYWDLSSDLGYEQIKIELRKLSIAMFRIDSIL